MFYAGKIRISKYYTLTYLQLQKFSTSTAIKYKFNIGVVKIPHQSKKEKGGEDAYVAEEGIICVADGVGGWNDQGVDPSKFSNELCENIKKEYFKNSNLHIGNPVKLFSIACENTSSIGSSTFCMCILDFEKEYLHTLNMGDSGYMLLRATSSGPGSIKNPNKTLNTLLSNPSHTDSPFDIIFKSPEQQHSFNFPYQVGTHGDRPDEAQIQVHKFEENDIIILATDGLWDNLYEQQILKILKPFHDISNQLKNLDIIAEMIGQISEKYSNDQKYKSPFSKKSKGLYLGGKADDITVIVAQIVKNELI